MQRELKIILLTYLLLLLYSTKQNKKKKESEQVRMSKSYLYKMKQKTTLCELYFRCAESARNNNYVNQRLKPYEI